MGTDRIYLDHAATTPILPQVVEEMLPYFQQTYGNPSSVHQEGRRVRSQIEQSRLVIARGLNVDEKQIIFTSGGTEADNTAVIGVAWANRDKGNHIITSSIEHHAVLHTCEYLQTQGFQVTYLPVDEKGRISLRDLQEAIQDTTTLISIMYGNNEVGTLQPIQEIAALAKEKGITFHSDAVQAFGTVPIDLNQLPVDLLSISGHKIGGPKGIGALYIGKGVRLDPFMHGGSQERQRRAGTENVPGIIGFAKAVELSLQSMGERIEKYATIREAMLSTWKELGIHYMVNGDPQESLPHILNVSFPHVDTEIMLMNLDLEGIYCSSGSACTAGALEISHVLQAMGLPREQLQSAVRFSFGWNNTMEECRIAAVKTANIIKRLRDR